MRTPGRHREDVGKLRARASDPGECGKTPDKTLTPRPTRAVFSSRCRVNKVR